MNFAECDVFEKGSRKWLVCRNEAGLSPKRTDDYREKWGLPRLFGEVTERGSSPVESVIPEFIFHGHSVGEGDAPGDKLYGPGTELLKIYEAAGFPSCDACTELAQRMNNWGSVECRVRLDEIVADILPRAMEWLKQEHPWAVRFLPDSVLGFLISKQRGLNTPDAIGKRIREDVIAAIDACEKVIADRREKKLNIFTGEKIRGCSSCSGAKPPKQVNTGYVSPFTTGKSPARFVTVEDYARDVRKLLALVPSDIDCVAGVARSGLYPASMVAMWLHKPMIIVSQSSGEIVEAGNGWRLGRGHNHVKPETGRVLVVDDTVMTGGSQQIIRRVVGGRFKEVIYATVYCNPLATLGKPDIHAVDLEWPHLLEWNLFNSVISKSVAVDFDGILCHDCTHDQDDDGDKYLDFIQNARPLYLPRKEPIPLIVTARVEKYRKPTEEWLARHSVGFEKLVMHPAKTTRQREECDIPAYKAEHFSRWAKSHRPAPGPIVFVESEDLQARRIAAISGRMTLCPATAGVYQG